MGNPFSLTFGKKPEKYIIRREKIDEIKKAFLDTPARSQTFLIKGVRGSGKTVLMTAFAQEISSMQDWISVDLNSTQNLLEDLSYRLADVLESSSGLLNRGFDISIAGFGVGIGNKENRDSVSRCEAYLDRIKKQNKKLLITIDEVLNDTSMKQFASQFQIWIRKDYPIYLLMTGLHENINAIQNNPQLTFLLRSPKLTLDALPISQIARQYESTLNISRETAIFMAQQTKGYAFAFQVLGMLYYDKIMDSNVADPLEAIDGLVKDMDEYLDEYVYSKIWHGLTEQEKNIISQLSDEKPSKVKDIIEGAQITSSIFSRYRTLLIEKGLINAQQHGYVDLVLPRFKEICQYYISW